MFYFCSDFPVEIQSTLLDLRRMEEVVISGFKIVYWGGGEYMMVNGCLADLVEAMKGGNKSPL